MKKRAWRLIDDDYVAYEEDFTLSDGTTGRITIVGRNSGKFSVYVDYNNWGGGNSAGPFRSFDDAMDYVETFKAHEPNWVPLGEALPFLFEGGKKRSAKNSMKKRALNFEVTNDQVAHKRYRNCDINIIEFDHGEGGYTYAISTPNHNITTWLVYDEIDDAMAYAVESVDRHFDELGDTEGWFEEMDDLYLKMYGSRRASSKSKKADASEADAIREVRRKLERARELVANAQLHIEEAQAILEDTYVEGPTALYNDMSGFDADLYQVWSDIDDEIAWIDGDWLMEG